MNIRELKIGDFYKDDGRTFFVLESYGNYDMWFISALCIDNIIDYQI